ncbi:uncharacterized protein LOC102362699 [Latimeria chalumnae]|uniref:uncharacterized protein LOC102362699 n=1 Tax=Latimeria chalumnae TaxID=7897 RepID=UPI0006D92E22|nr:PREDICTED: uncharacterized protein LOC102362699 [Latimeria chalumnae]|eukprot:XP_006005511.2 PREDICTED: uncharacterized protein LOC102362699 [Latimeria chalumnae]
MVLFLSVHRRMASGPWGLPGPDDHCKRMLVYGLVVLKNYHRALLAQLADFVNQADISVQSFLQASRKQLLKDFPGVKEKLQERINILQKVYSFYQQLCGDAAVEFGSAVSLCGLVTQSVAGGGGAGNACGQVMNAADTDFSEGFSSEANVNRSEEMQQDESLEELSEAKAKRNELKLSPAKELVLEKEELELVDEHQASGMQNEGVDILNSLESSDSNSEIKTLDMSNQELFKLRTEAELSSKTLVAIEDILKPCGTDGFIDLELPAEVNFQGHQPTFPLESFDKNGKADDSQGDLSLEASWLDLIHESHGTSRYLPAQELRVERRSSNISGPSLEASAFRVEKKHSDGTLTFSWVVTSGTEIWDTFEFSVSDVGQVSDRCHDCEINNEVPPSLAQEPSASEPFEECFSPGSLVPETAAVPECSTSPISEAGENDGRSLGPVIPKFVMCLWEEMEVMVSHVVDPHCFFIQPAGTDLQRLTYQLNEESSTNFTPIGYVPQIGSFVCAFCSKKQLWHRAQVKKLETSWKGDSPRVLVGVTYVDYGDTDYVPLSSLQELSFQFCTLPQQALCVALANVSPLYGLVWCRVDTEWFQRQVDGRTMYVRFYTHSSTITVELFTERGKVGIVRRGETISERMVRSGFAKHPDSQAGTPSAGARRVYNVTIPVQWKTYVKSYIGNKK